MTDLFQGMGPDLVSPPTNLAVIAPNDTTDLPFVTKAILFRKSRQHHHHRNGSGGKPWNHPLQCAGRNRAEHPGAARLGHRNHGLRPRCAVLMASSRRSYRGC